MLDFIAKEQAVCAPLLLGALWWWRQLAPGNPRLPGDREGTKRATLRDRLWEGARLIGPAGVLTLAFVWAHAHLIHDIYQGYGRLYYRLVPPGEALRQTLFAFNHVLLSFHRDPVVLPLAPPVLRAVRFVVEHFLALPLLLGALAWWRRDRTLGLGIVWVFSSLVPVAWLLGAHTARFYYLPAFGSALILAHGAQCCWRAAVSREERAARPQQRSLARCSRMGLVLSLIYVLIVNVSMITLSSLRYRDDSDLILAAFSVLREQAPRVPRGSLVVMRNLPASCFVKGAGLPDMVRIALRDRTAHSVLEGQILPYEWLDRLHQIPSQYLMDFSQHPLALRPIGNPDSTERNAARPREPGSSASRSGEPSAHQRA
jgi:hypothetical protein